MPRPVIPMGDVFFDPGLPPGNPGYNMPFPFEFRPSAGEYMFEADPLRNLFSPTVLRSQTRTVEAWRDIFSRFAPINRMISSRAGDFLSEMEPDFLYVRRYQDVNSAYNASLGEDGPPFSADNQSDLDQLSLRSVETEEVLHQIRRAARQPDLYCHAFARNTPGDAGIITLIALMFAEIKQLREGHDLFKHRVWVIAALCQSLRYNAYGYEMFGSTLGFLAIGQYFRRSVILDGTLYVDIGPVVDGDNPLLIEDMSLYNLLLYGMGEDEDPRNVAQELRPEATITDGAAGEAFYAYIKAMGQTWIQETRRQPTPTFEEMGLGGRFARVEDFSLEALGRACAEVFSHLQSERPKRSQEAQQEDWEQQSRYEQQGDHGFGRTRSRDGQVDERIDGADDLMLAKIHQKAEQGQTLSSLKKKEQSVDRGPGLTDKHKALLSSMMSAALDYEEEMGEMDENDDPEFRLDNILRSIR